MATPPAATSVSVKMRCTRISQYDQGGQIMKEAQFVTTDKDGQPLNPPEQLVYANFTGTFLSPFGDNITHDVVVDLSMAAAPEAAPTATPTTEVPPATPSTDARTRGE